MIVQMTMTKNECFLIKEMLPIWSKYVDGFVFISDNSTDDTVEYLRANREKYNILEIIEAKTAADMGEWETSMRQQLFDAAYKYSNKIICLDTDEYLDGRATKEELELILDQNPDTVFLCQSIQYTSKNKRRVDSHWKEIFHDRIGNYIPGSTFRRVFMHSSHTPSVSRGVRIDPSHLFIAHLQWLDKRWVGIKQYYWKVWDYVNNLEHGVSIINREDYDVSVNNFNWEYEDFSTPLKVNENIYSTQDIKNNYKLQYIVEQTKKHNIINLNDWGMGIHDYAIK
jgi:hypothetical protein